MCLRSSVTRPCMEQFPQFPSLDFPRKVSIMRKAYPLHDVFMKNQSLSISERLLSCNRNFYMFTSSPTNIFALFIRRIIGKWGSILSNGPWNCTVCTRKHRLSIKWCKDMKLLVSYIRKAGPLVCSNSGFFSVSNTVVIVAVVYWTMV